MDNNSIYSYYFYIFIIPIISLILLCICACCMCDRIGIVKINILHKISSHYSLSALLTSNTLAIKNDNNQIKVISSHKKLECFICFCKYNYPDCTILDCDHRIHTSCLLSWWCKTPLRIGECPMCRQYSHICLIELTKITLPITKNVKPSFIGFYRNDNEHKLLIRKPYNLPTTIISIHPSLKNNAQYMCEKLYNEIS